MKRNSIGRILCIILCFTTGFLLGGCAAGRPGGSTDSETQSSESSGGQDGAGNGTGSSENSLVDDGSVVTFRNEVEKTDVWILPDTEENRKLSVWGTATIGGLEKDKSAEVSLFALGGSGQYLVHMITPDEMYFGVSDIKLDAGYTMRFYLADEEYHVWMLEVKDADGNAVDDLEVFGARL